MTTCRLLEKGNHGYPTPALKSDSDDESRAFVELIYEEPWPVWR